MAVEEGYNIFKVKNLNTRAIKKYLTILKEIQKIGTILISIDKNMAIQNFGLSPASAPFKSTSLI